MRIFSITDMLSFSDLFVKGYFVRFIQFQLKSSWTRCVYYISYTLDSQVLLKCIQGKCTPEWLASA
jgi:hypothetical protein